LSSISQFLFISLPTLAAPAAGRAARRSGVQAARGQNNKATEIVCGLGDVGVASFLIVVARTDAPFGGRRGVGGG
jgi:hypothetical protein